jgi:L-rhamnose mutarotase
MCHHFFMRRYGMIIRLRPEAEAAYRQHHQAVWPAVLHTITATFGTTPSFFATDASSATTNTSAKITRQTCARWLQIPPRSSGGPSWNPCKNLFRIAPRASGGQRWKKSSTTTDTKPIRRDSRTLKCRRTIVGASELSLERGSLNGVYLTALTFGPYRSSI